MKEFKETHHKEMRARLAMLRAKLCARSTIKKFSAENQKFIGTDEVHLERTVAWIARAQDATPDDGVSRGNDLLPSSKSNADGWQPSYPETTGYIIPTMMDVAAYAGDETFLDRAKRMGEWELAIQRDDGAVHAGNIGKPAAPAVFDTGQVLRGYLALYKETKDERYKHAATRAISWIAKQEHHKEGRYITGNPSSVDQYMTTYMVYALAPVGAWGVALSNKEWIALARRSALATMAVQEENGWFNNSDFWEAERPLLHTIGYTIDGLFDIGVLLGEEKFVNGAKLALDGVLEQMDADGHIPGRLDRDWKAAAHFECLTGIAQVGVTAMKVYQRSGESSYKEKASRAKEFLKTCQNNFDEKLGGGIGAMWGSWPISGEYQSYQSLNWAAKYFADLLLYFMRATKETSTVQE